MNAIVIDEPEFRFKKYVFKDREHAGKILAEKLSKYAGEDAIILAIPSGGVPIGKIVAKHINARFDLMLVRKIQIPWNTEAGFGAITYDGVILFNEPLMAELGLTGEEIDNSISKTRNELMKRMKIFRGERPMPDLKDKVVILVDDGLASGFTMLAAIQSVKGKMPRKIIVAVPTASSTALNLIAPYVDEIVCLNIRSGYFFAVADAYMNWYDLTDEDVLKYLKE
ncbi:MAG: phosphoribosyltransferase family protein [Nitrososphaerota archaeon]|nr:phosphoribosyltransferase family protein [Nitrososphaerales archaeon]MDW8044566.1 phosphoribosyltransferase family protein [Nitrososphaerota archaeon]